MSGQSTGATIGFVLGAAVAIVATWGAALPVVLGTVALYAGIGSTVGGLAGGIYDTMNAPDVRNEQENIADFYMQTSSLGNAIPQLVGHERFAGNVFYLGERRVVEVKQQAGGGKGGGSKGATNVIKTYEVDLAIALCDTRVFGPVKGIRKIWRDGTLWQTKPNGTALPPNMTFYPGTLDQLPDPTIEAVKGVGNVPGYPYLCYVVINDYDMGLFPRVPTFTFELYQDNTPLIAGQQLAQRSSDGSLWAASPATNEVLVYDATTEDIVDTVLVSEEEPHGTSRGFPMGWEGTTALWLAHPVDYSIVRIRADDRLVTDTFTVPYSLLSGGLWANGDMWFCAYHYETKGGYLIRVNNTGIQATITCGQAQGGHMQATAGLDGHIWVTDNHFPNGGGNSNVLRINPTTNTVVATVSVGFDEAASPIDIATGADGHIWVAIAEANTVRRINPATNTIMATVGIGAGTPLQLGVASDGYIWVASTLDGGTVHRINPATNTDVTFDSLDLALPSPAHELFAPGTAGAMWVLSEPTWTLQLFDTAGDRTLRNLEGPPRGVVAEGSTSAMTIATNGELERTMVSGTRAVSPSLQLPRLRAVITVLCQAAGFTPAEIDVSDIPNPVVSMKIVNVVAVKAPLQQLMDAYQLFAYESNLKIVFKSREVSAVVATIPERDLDAHAPDSNVRASQGLRITRLPDDVLPTEVRLSYISRQRSYQQNTQIVAMSTSQAPATNSRATSIPVVLSERQAMRLARETLDQVWIQRTTYQFSVNRDYAFLEPGDRIEVTSRGVTHSMILTQITYGRPGIMECLARSDIDGAVNVLTSQPGAGTTVQRIPAAAHTNGHLLDLPAMSAADQVPRYHVAYQYPSSEWPGAALHKSVDGGVTYTHVDADWRYRATSGTVETPLADTADWYFFDDTHTFTVVLTSGELASANDDELYGEANMALLGNEVLQFGIATLIAPLTYTCSHLLRGRRGTEWAIGTHAADERFILLDIAVRPLPMPVSERTVTRQFKTVTSGVDIGDVPAATFAGASENLKPWAITDAEAVRVGNDWLFTWTARSRFSGDWSDNEPFGYDPDFLLFRVFIFTDNTYTERVHTFHITPTLDPASVQSFTYSAADQVIDFGSVQSTLYYRIAQVGSYGIGRMTDLVGVT